MKIAVTTESGHLGSAIIRQLVRDLGASNVIGIARTPENAKHQQVEIRNGDYNNRDDFEKALDDIDSILLVSGMDKPENRIRQHRNVIDAAKACKVKKIVYTSIIGDPVRTAFSPIVKSNRQTEEDIMNSGLHWVIGRNGLYIEPDLEYIDNYANEGAIKNSAGNGKCAYTSRNELAYAYSQMLRNDKHHSKIYNLAGEPVQQAELCNAINDVFGTNIVYEEIPVDIFTKNRQNELGDFLGTIVGGIYEGIKTGAFDVPSGFEKAAGRLHQSLREMVKNFKHLNES